MVPTCACCNRSSVGGAGLNTRSNTQFWRWMDRQVFSQGYGSHISHPPPSLLILNYTFTHSLATMHHAPCTMQPCTMHHATMHHATIPCHRVIPTYLGCASVGCIHTLVGGFHVGWGCSMFVFGYLGWGCLNCTRLKILFWFWSVAPNTNTTILHRAAKVFRDTWDGGV